MKTVILDAKTLGDDLDLLTFEQYGKLTIYDYTSKDEVVERIKDQELIIANKVVLDESNLKYAPNLKLICVTATGTNNIDLKYAKKRSIGVTNVAGYSTKSVAQHTFAMLFYLMEHLAYYDNYVKSEAYVDDKIFTHFEKKYYELTNKTWGIIGLGAIGKRVARIAEMFDCNIIYYSTSGKNKNTEYENVELDQLLEQSDIVSIHCPLNDRTKNLITYNELNKMKRSAILLNLGRGTIVNEADLVKAINDNIIAGAGLDVLSKEPINKDNPLLSIKDSDKLIITPHIAWASVEARKQMIKEVKQNINAFLAGEKRNRVE